MATTTGITPCASDYYLSKEGAAHYKRKYARLGKRISHRKECSILRRLLRKAGKARTILDIPCGTGRFFPVISAFAQEVHMADMSPQMLEVGREVSGNKAAAYQIKNVFDLDALSADGIVSARLMQHLHDEALQLKYFEALAQAASKWIIVTFRDSQAPHTIFRRLMRRIKGKDDLAAMSTRRVRGIMKGHGFNLIESLAVSGFFSGHKFALFVRAGQCCPPPPIAHGFCLLNTPAQAILMISQSGV
ncbi:MAG TPA: class I SAM-dependent methyltransferase [Terriglobia bacterium]|nr:class I SAM-dependent methyltransferase [Terriglobia bacterium]